MATLQAQSNTDRIAILREGLTLPVLIQNATPNLRPYIHPILAPDGIGELTEDQPGHHVWQHGLYVGLNDVNGAGFWTEGHTGNPADGTFHPRPLQPPVVSDNTAAWEVVTDWNDPQGNQMLTETQRWQFTDNDAVFVLDVEWTLQATVDVRFGRFDYGGLFLRMPWRRETGGDVLTSEGADSPATAEAQRARWVALSMPIPGRTLGPAGIAFLDHPTNPEHPAPWRVDGNLGITPSRCIAGEWFLPKGERSANRYRLLVFTGTIDPQAVEAEWNRFSQI